jgi:hypothetical protein
MSFIAAGGSGLNSLLSSNVEVFVILATSKSTVFQSFMLLDFMDAMSIWPPLTIIDSRKRSRKYTLTVPSNKTNLNVLPTRSTKPVVPVMAAVIAAVLILAPPKPLGIWNRMAP